MTESLPVEETQDIDRIAEGIARFAQIMISQKIEHEATQLGMDAPAKEYLYEKTCSLLFRD